MRPRLSFYGTIRERRALGNGSERKMDAPQMAFSVKRRRCHHIELLAKIGLTPGSTLLLGSPVGGMSCRPSAGSDNIRVGQKTKFVPSPKCSDHMDFRIINGTSQHSHLIWRRLNRKSIRPWEMGENPLSDPSWLRQTVGWWVGGQAFFASEPQRKHTAKTSSHSTSPAENRIYAQCLRWNGSEKRYEGT